MGGRGAATGYSYRMLRKRKKDGSYGYEPYGKEYGTEFNTVYKVGHIRFVKNTGDSVTPPVETRSGSKRIYVTVGKDDRPKHITYYAKNGQRIKQIDLYGPAHTVNGIKIPTPHTHLGYLHDEGGTRTSLTNQESAMIDFVNKVWKNRK